MNEHVRFFGVSRRTGDGASHPPVSHIAHGAGREHSFLPDDISPRQDNLPATYAAPVFSSADKEFACLCFAFATLVGAPVMLIALTIGLLISFD